MALCCVARRHTRYTGAVELSRDRKSCHRSRHVDRRYFKVRELFFEGELVVESVPTADNSADLLTKSLPRDAYERHRARLLNIVYDSGASVHMVES